jgi:hypothetical protein
MGQGLQRVLKQCGEIKFTDKDGNSAEWVWDYKNDKAILKSEMTHEMWCESEREKHKDLINNKTFTENLKQ